MAPACVTNKTTETASFEGAEKAYRRGDYIASIDGYKDFLKRYPTSSLADIAKLRVRCINREIHVMRGPSDRPRPIYHRPIYRAESKDATRE